MQACYKLCSSASSCGAFDWQATAAKCTIFKSQKGATFEGLLKTQAEGHTSGILSPPFIYQQLIVDVQSSPLHTSRRLLQLGSTSQCISSPYTLYHVPFDYGLDLADARDVQHCCDLCRGHKSKLCASYQYSTADNSCTMYSHLPTYVTTGVQDACAGRVFCPSVGKLVGYLPGNSFDTSLRARMAELVFGGGDSAHDNFEQPAE